MACVPDALPPYHAAHRPPVTHGVTPACGPSCKPNRVPPTRWRVPNIVTFKQYGHWPAWSGLNDPCMPQPPTTRLHPPQLCPPTPPCHPPNPPSGKAPLTHSTMLSLHARPCEQNPEGQKDAGNTAPKTDLITQICHCGNLNVPPSHPLADEMQQCKKGNWSRAPHSWRKTMELLPS